MPTTQEIYEEIIAEKETGGYVELEDLNSTSKVAIWRLLIYIVSFASKTIHELFESFKKYIEDIFANNQHGTLHWWIEQIRVFQYEDILEFIDGIYKYAIEDKTKRIVKRTALETLNFVLLFKVATEDGNGDLIPLDTDQKSALQAYINKVKFPGTYTSVISESADDLKLNLRVYHNAEVPTTELDITIAETVDLYLKNIVFNGKFNLTGLTDELQVLRGIENPVFQESFAKPSASPTIDYQVIEDYYASASGYFTVAELNIEYIAYV